MFTVLRSQTRPCFSLIGTLVGIHSKSKTHLSSVQLAKQWTPCCQRRWWMVAEMTARLECQPQLRDTKRDESDVALKQSFQDMLLFTKHKMIPRHRGWTLKSPGRTGRRRSTLLEYRSFLFPGPPGFVALPDVNGSHWRANLAHTTNTATSTPLQPGSLRQSKHQQLSAKRKEMKKKAWYMSAKVQRLACCSRHKAW